MSIIYLLPEIDQEDQWLCWRQAAIIALSANADAKLAEDWVKNKSKELPSKSYAISGLPPYQLLSFYRGLGLLSVAQDRVNINLLASESPDRFFIILQDLLVEYGPLVLLRYALSGDEALHTETVVGVTRSQPLPEHPTGVRIWVHDTMNRGQLTARSFELFQAFITIRPTKKLFLDLSSNHDHNIQITLEGVATMPDDVEEESFEHVLWYNKEHVGCTNQIAKRDLQEYCCIDIPAGEVESPLGSDGVLASEYPILPIPSDSPTPF